MKNLTTKFREFPVLRTQRLTLRELVTNDKEDIFQIFSNPEVTKYYDVETMKSVDAAEDLILYWQKRIKSGKAFRWGISFTGNPRIIGTCGFSQIDKENFSAEIGCDLAQNYWGQKIMTEALRAMLQFGFDQMGLNRIETWVMKGNLASTHLVQKIGFRYEGLLLERQYWNGIFHDVHMLGLLKRDWESINTPAR